jgi:type III secretory pathway component EscS
MSWMLGPLREGIMTILIVAGPIILAAAGVGLLIGILQAATQIQDQAIPSAMKLIGILLLLVFMGMWMFTYLTNFTEKTIGRAFSMVINNRTPVTYSGKKAVGNPQATLEPALGVPLPPLSPVANNSGSFQATLAPPMGSFNNAMQTAAPPSSVKAGPPTMNLNYGGGSYPSQGQQFSMNSGSASYPQQQFPNQNYNPQQMQGAYGQAQYNGQQNMPSNNGATQAQNAPSTPAKVPVQQSAPPPFNSSRKTVNNADRRTPVNRVILQNDNDPLPAPVQIRPKLPGTMASSAPVEDIANYSAVTQATGDRLDPPGHNKAGAANSGIESSGSWW